MPLLKGLLRGWDIIIHKIYLFHPVGFTRLASVLSHNLGQESRAIFQFLVSEIDDDTS